MLIGINTCMHDQWRMHFIWKIEYSRKLFVYPTP